VGRVGEKVFQICNLCELEVYFLNVHIIFTNIMCYFEQPLMHIFFSCVYFLLLMNV